MFQHELAHLRSISDFVTFTQTELKKLEDLKKISPVSNDSIFGQFEQFQSLSQWLPDFLWAGNSKPVQKNEPAVFLLSSPRSGSTLLRVLLAGHPDLFSPPEPGILRFDTMADWYCWTEKSGLPQLFSGIQAAFTELLGLDGDRSLAFVRDLVDKKTPIEKVYERLQHLAQPRTFVDKTPSYSLQLSTLKRAERLFHRPKYLFIMRHPYAMMDSFLRVRLHRLLGPILYGQNQVDPHVVAEKVWLKCNSNVCEFLKGIDSDRQHWVKFEDLVSNTRPVMKGIADFLKIPFDDCLLNPYDHRSRMIYGVGDFNILRHDKIDPKLGERWRQIQLPRPLSAKTAALADEFNYVIKHRLPETNEP